MTRDWQNVIFSDESSFWAFSSQRKAWSVRGKPMLQRSVKHPLKKNFASTFDNLWWPALFERLRRVGCPPALYKCFRSYCQDRYVIMRCPQGSICSPEFWDITMEGLLQDLVEVPEVEKALAYTDDLLLIIAASSRRHLEERANTALSRLVRWCDAQKLQISTGKTTFTMLRGSMQKAHS
ncbi:hypothetical protein Trydic_g23149 [Trypoxylus dichotomus]